jgi:hypothetical protein
MTRTTVILTFLMLCLFTACSNESTIDRTIIPVQQDSLVQEAIIEEQVSSSNLLVDLSYEKNIQKLLSQGWVMEDDQDILKDNNEAEGMFPYRSFYLFDDYTFTKNVRNYLEYGQWTYSDNKKTFYLKSANGSTDEYKIAAIGAEDMIVINSGINSVTQLKFRSTGKKYSSKKDDPYYVDNNRWRIRPRYSETDEQIKKRLKDCLHFYILFYKDNLERRDGIISFYGFPTCLKWYGGGIFMIKKADLADNWFACFYNKEQAMKAYNMMEEVIVKKYKWEKGKVSWVKKNLGVLEQMYESL